MSGTIIQRVINRGGGAFALSEIPGYAQGFVPKYDTTTRVIITAGNYEVDGDLFNLAADATHTLTGLITAFGFQYIYLDKTASSPTVPAFYDENNTVDEPVFSIAKNGWYHPTNTEDRIVGVVHSPAASATIQYFDTVVISSKIIRNSLERLLAATVGAPNGAWQTPNVAETSTLTPVNAKEIEVFLSNSDTNALIALAWRNNEAAAIQTVFNDSPHFQIGFGIMSAGSWGALGDSRNIKIAGDDDDENGMQCTVRGYGYER